MPTITENRVTLWVHCGDPYCDGNTPEKVAGTHVETALTYNECGGDGTFNGIEKSFQDYRLDDQDDLPCPHCRQDRIVSPIDRPVYPHVTGFDQKGLLYFKEQADKKVLDLERSQAESGAKHDTEIAVLKAQIEMLTKHLAGQQEPKRGPGRPPKQQPAE